MIEIKELDVTIAKNTILNDINLSIENGEKLIILGPNGAGKTTLLKIIATIIRPNSGKVFFDKQDITKDATRIRQRIGLIGHQTFLYQNLTAHENLSFYCRLYNIKEREKRIKEVTELVSMSNSSTSLVKTLSRGMQQRISIARALLHEPKVLLLDEPETGLDPHAIQILRTIVKSRNDEKRTMIMTTHNLSLGFELANRVLILSRGRIVYEEYISNLDLDRLEKVYKDRTEF